MLWSPLPSPIPPQDSSVVSGSLYMHSFMYSSTIFIENEPFFGIERKGWFYICINNRFIQIWLYVITCNHVRRGTLLSNKFDTPLSYIYSNSPIFQGLLIYFLLFYDHNLKWLRRQIIYTLAWQPQYLSERGLFTLHKFCVSCMLAYKHPYLSSTVVDLPIPQFYGFHRRLLSCC